MKKLFVITAAGILVMMSGCSTATVLQTPVGPDPLDVKGAGNDGALEVFSATERENNIGFEFAYNQRTDYSVYDSTGKALKHVDNNTRHFEAAPRSIPLPPGAYTIRALASVGVGEWITVPVVIESGRTTEVQLNGHWKPATGVLSRELVRGPAGFPIGWNAGNLPNS